MSQTSFDTNANAAELQYVPSIIMDGSAPGGTGGAFNLGIYDKLTGGDAQAQVVKHRPGGMGPEKSYLSLPVYTTLTVSRVYEEARDHAIVGILRTLVGNTYATISMQPYNAAGQPWGSPSVYRGRLTNVKAGNADSSSSQPRMYELDFEIESISN